MPWKKVGKWSGGYVRQLVEAGQPKGRPVYVIEKRVDGVRFHVSTRCHDRGAAERQLMRFEANPAAYSPAGEAKRAGLYLTADMVQEYGNQQEASGLTGEWVDEVGRCLVNWLDALHGKDLRTLALHRDLKPFIEARRTRKAQHIKALKGLFRWLRQEKGLLKHHEDATLDLRVPQAKPEKWGRRKVVTPEAVQLVLPHLPAPFADVLHLLTATAWHLTEVRRFTQAGEVVPATGPVLAVLVTRHKGGELTRTPLQYPEHVETARRLLGLRVWPQRMAFARAMRAACAAAGVPYFGMGVMRHSVLTWGAEAGMPIAALAEFAGHKSASTTRRFYVDVASPTNVIPIRRLQR